LSVVLHVNVAGATLEKQADHRLQDLRNTGGIYEVIWRNSILAQHVFAEGHRVFWDQAEILQNETNHVYDKHKDSAAHVMFNKSYQSIPALKFCWSDFP
jgi:hypothetical protein